LTIKEQKGIFDNWLSNYEALLFKVVRAYAYTIEDRNDLFQDIAVEVWKSIPNFKGMSSPTTWLYRIALNNAMKWSSKSQMVKNRHQPLDQSEFVLKAEQTLPDERLEWLYREVAKLNEIDRSLCLLLFDGLSYKEMSGILGISESNVGVKINRIKKVLIKKSEKYDRHGV